MAAVSSVRNWEVLADDSALARTVKALEGNGFNVLVVDSPEEAKQKVIELLPEGSEVFTAASATLQNSGIAEEVNESGRYNSIRKQMSGMKRETHFLEMRRLGSTPEIVVGSVHAITEQGHLVIASFGGSQLPAYAYGAGKVIWVVGAQKIVKDLDEGIRRIEEHSLPLESQRLQQLLGRASEIGKILIVRKEVQPGRATVVIVKANLGF